MTTTPDALAQQALTTDERRALLWLIDEIDANGLSFATKAGTTAMVRRALCHAIQDADMLDAAALELRALRAIREALLAYWVAKQYLNSLPFGDDNQREKADAFNAFKLHESALGDALRAALSTAGEGA